MLGPLAELLDGVELIGGGALACHELDRGRSAGADQLAATTGHDAGADEFVRQLDRLDGAVVGQGRAQATGLEAGGGGGRSTDGVVRFDKGHGRHAGGPLPRWTVRLGAIKTDATDPLVQSHGGGGSRVQRSGWGTVDGGDDGRLRRGTVDDRRFPGGGRAWPRVGRERVRRRAGGTSERGQQAQRWSGWRGRGFDGRIDRRGCPMEERRETLHGGSS